MNRKWYKSNIAKVILVLFAHIMTMVMVSSFLWIVAYPTLRQEIFEGNPAKAYKDTVNFSEQMLEYSRGAVTGISSKKLFETDGKFDPDKTIDIVQYMKAEIGDSGELSYRLGDMIEWYKMLSEETKDPESIVVCKKPDDTYYYYHMSDFVILIKSGTLSFVQTSEDLGITEERILSELEYGESQTDSNIFRGIQDQEGRIIYSDCWKYDGVIEEELYEPIGVDSIITLVNENPEWNGRLSEVYNLLDSAIYEIGSQYENYENINMNLEEGDTNLSYIYVDTKSGTIYTNRKEYRSYERLEENLEKMKDLGKYAIVMPKLADFESNMEVDASLWRDEIKYSGISQEDFLFAVAVDTQYPVQDSFYRENTLYEKYGSGAKSVAALGLSAAVLLLVCIVWLVVVAGRGNEDDKLHLNWFDRWKTELAVLYIPLCIY